MIEKLEVIAQMTVDEARQQLLDSIEQEARNDMARIIRQVEAEARETADQRARSLIAMAIQRLASEQVNEISVSVVHLPSDDMKGRIIGRNGRNIRSFELATGVDVVVDDSPESVTISSFDPGPARGRQAHDGQACGGRPHSPGANRKTGRRHSRRSRADRPRRR